MNDLALPRLMLVTDRRRCGGRALVEVVAAAVAGGVRWVQVRDKELSDSELVRLVDRLGEVLPAGTMLSVNGRPGVALRCGCGLHLPEAAALPRQTDRPREVPWGRSAHGVDAAIRASRERLDYVIVGTIFATSSKPGLPAAGRKRIREVRRSVDALPIFAIGGMTARAIPAVLASGASGVAVCSAILGADDPAAVAAELCRALQDAVGS